MRVTIVTNDNLVIVDGKPHTVDCSELLARGVHAVQWDDDNGEVEWKAVTDGQPPNSAIVALTQYQMLIDAWQVVENTPPSPSPTPPVIIPTITRRQLILMLLQLGYITGDEAVAAAKNGDVPAFILGYFDALAGNEKAIAIVTWASMSICTRDDPMMITLAATNNISDAQLDAFFVTAANL